MLKLITVKMKKSIITLLNSTNGWLSIEFSNACNLKCLYCYRQNVDVMPIQFIDRRLINLLIKDLHKNNWRFSGVKLNWLGESTLHPEFMPIMREIHNAYFYNYLSLETNLNIDISDLFIDWKKPLYIFISIDTIDKRVYEIIKGYDYLDFVLKNIENILRFRKGYPKIRLQIIVTPENINTINETILFFKKHFGISRVLFNENLTLDYDYILLRRLIDPENQKRANLLFKKLKDKFQDIPDYKSDSEKRKRGPCEKLWTTPFIRANGDVIFCNEDPEMKLKLGNIKTNSFTNIWLNSKIENMRILHAKREFYKLPEKCKNCNVYWDTLHNDFFNKFLKIKGFNKF